jgi:thiamine-phosphate pyrophosphorylase
VRHIEKSKQLGLPIVAIGGIDHENAAPLIVAGADFVAVVGAIFNAPDITKATAAFAALFD